MENIIDIISNNSEYGLLGLALAGAAWAAHRRKKGAPNSPDQPNVQPEPTGELTVETIRGRVAEHEERIKNGD